jgi:urease accessory protein
MTAFSRLLEQRSVGHVKLRMERGGVAHLRESGAAKIRVPRGSREAILINTGGGIAGGDAFSFDLSCGAGADLTVTSQAAERVYRTLGPPAIIEASLGVGGGGTFSWLPQECIVFNGASLRRSYTVSLEARARFLAVEPIVFGRMEMGEIVDSIALKDRWRISRAGSLIHADDFVVGPALVQSTATLNGARAMATLIYVAEDAERHVDKVRGALGESGGASAWNGKLVARILAKDSFHLRKSLIPVLYAIIGREAVPKIWTM